MGSNHFLRMRQLFSASMLLLLSGLFSAGAQAAVTIQHWQTTAGAKVFFVENHDLPLLDISVHFAAGSSRDQAAQSGLASMTLHLLDLGAAGLSDDDIARRMADVGAVLSGSFDQDRAGVSLRTLSSAREQAQAVDTLAKVLQSPDFPEAVLTREKARVIAALKEAATQPEQIADKAFNAALYGKHPYALPPSGEIATVSALQRQDLVDFYRAHYSANNAVIALIGDIDKTRAQALAEQLTAKLPAASAQANPPEVEMHIQGAVQRIAHPAKQSHILLGTPGVRRGDPDYFPLYVGNYVLGGGGFDSRLLIEVRQKRGLAYSAYSYFMPLRQEGPFEIGLQTKKEQADQALAVVRDTLKEFVAKGPAPEELKQAKANIIGGFPLRIDSNKKILEYLGVIGFYDLPLTYLDDFVKNVEKVTVKDIQQAFARRIRPDELVTVMVGAPEEKKPSH